MPRLTSFGNDNYSETPSDYRVFEIIERRPNLISYTISYLSYELTSEGIHYADVASLDNAHYLYKSPTCFLEVTAGFAERISNQNSSTQVHSVHFVEAVEPASKEVCLQAMSNDKQVAINIVGFDLLARATSKRSVEMALKSGKCLGVKNRSWTDSDAKSGIKWRISVPKQIGSPERDYVLLCLLFLGSCQSCYALSEVQV